MNALRDRLGRVLRRRRDARTLTQEQVADAAGVHRNYVGMLERGERTVSVDTLDRITTALGVTLAAFFAEVDAEVHVQVHPPVPPAAPRDDQARGVEPPAAPASAGGRRAAES